MVSTYSLPGTVLPKKKLEIGEYAVACNAFQTQAVYDKHMREVHDRIKAISINWSIPIWDQSISQVTNKVYMRTQHISSRGY